MLGAGQQSDGDADEGLMAQITALGKQNAAKDEQMRTCANEQLGRMQQCLLDAASGQDELLGEAVAEDERGRCLPCIHVVIVRGAGHTQLVSALRV